MLLNKNIQIEVKNNNKIAVNIIIIRNSESEEKK